ncbi:MAG: phosphotransferase [Caldilineaceae bacterium]|nr:phosphotransferase [Caldilineaceae bacterium]
MSKSLLSNSLLPWQKPGWRTEVESWIRRTLADMGAEPTDAIAQPHIRSWSTVLTIPTTAGLFYFKATAPTLRHEPALTSALSQWHADCVPHVLAASAERGWLLMADSGPSLRSIIKQDRDLAHWRTVLHNYARLQKEVAPRAAELLQLGTLDRRLAQLPALLAQLLEDRDALLLDQEDGLVVTEYETLRGLLPRFEEMCRQLAVYGIPETLHHDDFHDGNIFVQMDHATSAHGYTFADWGESCVAHPFFTLVVTLRSIAYTLELDSSDAAIGALRDHYLAQWSSYGSMDELRSAFALANRIGMVNRALTWYLVVSALEGAEKAAQAASVPGWLQEFLEAMAN